MPTVLHFFHQHLRISHYSLNLHDYFVCMTKFHHNRYVLPHSVFMVYLVAFIFMDRFCEYGYYLHLQAEENLGMVMIFTLVTAVQEKLNEIVDQIKSRQEEEKRRKEKEAEEAEKVGTIL